MPAHQPHRGHFPGALIPEGGKKREEVGDAPMKERIISTAARRLARKSLRAGWMVYMEVCAATWETRQCQRTSCRQMLSRQLAQKGGKQESPGGSHLSERDRRLGSPGEGGDERERDPEYPRPAVVLPVAVGRRVRGLDHLQLLAPARGHVGDEGPDRVADLARRAEPGSAVIGPLPL